MKTRATAKRRAFTLVELMISIAMVLLLVAGIAAVFKTSSDTVRTGLAIASITRDQRGAEQVFVRDFNNAVPLSQQPCIIIMSQQQYAFMDRNDMNSSPNPNNPGVDANGNPSPTAIYDSHNHRIDRLCFFIRDWANPMLRQTGDQTNPSITSQEYANEAFLWYGHLRQPDNTVNPNTPTPNPQRFAGGGNYHDPGADNAPDINPNNYFVSQWVLGRVPILLKSNPSGDYLQRQFDPVVGNTVGNLTPLAGYSRAVNVGQQGRPLTQPRATAIDWAPQHSRFDIAQGTIASYRDNFQLAWNTAAVNRPRGDIWYQDFDYRFNVKPWLQHNTTGALTTVQQLQDEAEQMALTTPFLQKGVSQFIVEFAGDFVTQQNNPAGGIINGTNYAYGDVVNANPDGVLDFVRVTDPATGNWVRRIRWYGMPRNDETADDVTFNKVGGVPQPYIPGVGATDRMVNVVPVWTYATSAGAGPAQPTFEHVYDPANNNFPNYTGYNDYAKAPNAGGMPAGWTYIAAWSPNDLANGLGPKLIRITITLTDPSGRLPEGQTFQYVYALQP